MNALAPEPILQLYRGGVPGPNATAKRDKLRAVVAQAAALKLGAVIFHGFPRELLGAWDSLAKMAGDEGVSALASWGLDGETDGGKPFTGRAKGELMGALLAKPTCLGGLLDAEGRWDDGDDARAGDVTDRDDALAMGEALRTKAPSALLGDQPWFAIDSHGSVRTKPAADPRDVFKGYPVDEFARVVNWRRFRQAYCNQADFKARWGTARYEKVFAWMERDWKLLEAPFARAGLPLERGVTIQGYGWDDAVSDLVHVVLTTCVTKGQELIVWCDYAPSAVVVAGVRALAFLRARGFATPDATAEAIVRAYQLAFNATSPTKPLDVDGACGLKTLETMGISP